MGRLDPHSFENLHLVAEITQRIRIRASGRAAPDSEDHEDDYAAVMPTFLWVLRDHQHELVDEDGNPISPSEYLEDALKDETGKRGDVTRRNETRRALKKIFRHRGLITLVRPVISEKELRAMDSLPESRLRDEFKEGLVGLRRHIFENLTVKTLFGDEVDGLGIIQLLRSYIDCINEGAVPHIHSAWDSVKREEAERAISNAIRTYRDELKEAVDAGISSERSFVVTERAVRSRAIEGARRFFLGNSMQEYSDRLVAELDAVLQSIEEIWQLTMEKRITEQARRISHESAKQIEALRNDGSTMSGTALVTHIFSTINSGLVALCEQAGGNLTIEATRIFFSQELATSTTAFVDAALDGVRARAAESEAKVTAEKAQLYERIQALELSKDDLHARSSEQIQTLQRELSAIQNERRSLQNTVDEMRGRTDSMSKQLAMIQQEKAAAQSELERMRTHAATIETELITWKRNSEVASEQRAIAQAEVSHLASKLAEMERRIFDKDREMAEVHERHANELQNLQNSAEEAVQQRDRHVAELMARVRELEATQSYREPEEAPDFIEEDDDGASVERAERERIARIIPEKHGVNELKSLLKKWGVAPIPTKKKDIVELFREQRELKGLTQ